MPEIAEVALMADSIRNILPVNPQIISIVINGGKYQSRPLKNLEEFNTACPLNILSVNTKGKFCWIELADDWIIGLTFGMTGTIMYQSETEVPHVTFNLNDNCRFFYHDVRRFGNITLTNDRRWLQSKLKSLGPDMLTGPEITDEQFIQALRRFDNQNICKVLMNQKAVSGIGNYLKSEVLYKAKISPFICVKAIPDKVLSELHRIIRQTTKQAYQAQGASLYTYKSANRRKGSFQKMLQVYGKTYDPKGRKVLKVKTSDGRSTYFVPEVQKVYVC